MSDDTDRPACEGCQTAPAVVSLIITNSQSAANISYSCAACSLIVVHDWLFRPDPGDDIAGWEITRLGNARPVEPVVIGGAR